MTSVNDVITKEFEAHKQTIESVIGSMESQLEKAAYILVKVLKSGNKILLCGNGGSAADAQHIAAELTGRYKAERRGLPAIALTTDTSALTAISNDYGYAKVFDRQVEALANKGDLLIGISTSGNSENIISALKTAKERECLTLGFSGHNGGKMNDICDINLVIPSDDTPRIQEMHILFGHILCQIVDDAF
jgi:D-sedoheptulose 7-phosphate isomerase